MPRITTVKKSRKDQGNCGRCGDPLPAGSSYRHWSFRYGGTRKRCMKPECTPRRSDLTQNEVLVAAYDIADDNYEVPVDLETFRETVSDIYSRIQEEVLELIEEKMNNIADGFGHTEIDAYYNLEEMQSEVEAWADTISTLEYSDEFVGESEACRECSLSYADGEHETDESGAMSGGRHYFEPEEEFDGDTAYEALQDALGELPI